MSKDTLIGNSGGSGKFQEGHFYYRASVHKKPGQIAMGMIETFVYMGWQLTKDCVNYEGCRHEGHIFRKLEREGSQWIPSTHGYVVVQRLDEADMMFSTLAELRRFRLPGEKTPE